MIPRGAIVSCPRCRVALPPRIGCACQHKGPLIRLELQQALIGSPRVLHAEDVVYLKMSCSARHESRLVDAMLHGVGHRLGGNFEDRWLVHVVPKARDAFLIEVLVQRAPPRAALLTCEVGKDGWARPYLSYVK